MNRNVEVKARVKDPHALELALRQRCSEPAVLDQRDTFFRGPSGRLKLREEATTAELIFYARGSELSARESRYWRSSVSDVAGTIALLAAALGIDGVVQKRRLLFLIGQTRVHLDAVDGLGAFVELEVVLSEAQAVVDGKQIATELMAELGIAPDDLIGPAYIDLLKQAEGASSSADRGFDRDSTLG
jgi:predicted adenylyl cyclase CyaB